MRKVSLFAALFVLVAFAAASAVQVTFVANTATVPDTLGFDSVVQVRGGGGPLTWDGGSPVLLTNQGTAENPSDYWVGSAEFTDGENI